MGESVTSGERPVGTLPPALGYLEWMGEEGGALTLIGWMLRADLAHDALSATLDGAPVPSVERLNRPDVAAAISHVPHAGTSGFRIRFGPGDLPPGRTGHLELTGLREGVPIFRHAAPVRSDLETLVPTPPPELMARVGGVAAPSFFKLGGLAMAAVFQEALAAHAGSRPPANLLDWGCGCGRLLGFAVATWGIPDVQGCDIDGEAVAWCAAHYPGQRFARIPEMPPTAYPTGTFESVIGFSVFTHLTRPVQEAWLSELHRIMASGGLLLATVHGDFAARVAFGEDAPRRLRSGIYDEIPDGALVGVASAGYYRGTYQTRAYTLDRWSRLFEILEYREQGIGNHQDLVVMRKRA